MSWLLAIAIGLFSLSASVWDQPANRPISKSELEKWTSQIEIGAKHYSVRPGENIGLYGVIHKHYLTDELYWGEFGYGALSGIRSGYLEGGVCFGYLSSPVIGGVRPEFKVLVGAGGGGSAPQGGGLMINPSVGLNVPISSELSWVPEVGYIHFLNGDISSLTTGIYVVYTFSELGIRNEN